MADAQTAAPAQSGGDRDTLFYDGRCPLCAGEIEQLRRARGDLALVDIHSLPAHSHSDDSAAAGAARAPSRDALLRTLHLRRGDGQWLRGADANVAAWSGTFRGRLLRVLRWPLLRHGVDAVYALWAAWRYRRLYGKSESGDAAARR